MRKVASLWKVVSSWYVSMVILAAAGIAIGYFAFFNVYGGKPKVGVIDIPFTIINDDSAFVISAYLDFARRDDDIKAVFIRLNSPGGGAAASEALFVEMRKLREKKPVVVAMTDIVASGGYMMALGANYTYAKSSSLVGSIGVILAAPGSLIPSPPRENVITTGPFKVGGGTRRHFVGLTDELKRAFVSMVVAERGSKLRISPEEITQAKIYSGVEGVNLGLVDAIGGDTEAIEKAASLAGISNYDLVDVNVEVFRIFNEKFARIIEPLATAGRDQASVLDLPTIVSLFGKIDDSDSSGGPGDSTIPGIVRRSFLPSGTGESQDDALPGFPLKVNPPNIYYLYVGPSE